MPLPTLGAHTFGFVWSDSVERALDMLGENKFRSIQILAAPPHFDPWRNDPDLARRMRAIMDRHGMTLLALDLPSSDINLASGSQDVVDFAVDAYCRTIAHAAELGSRWVCISSGRRHPLLATANQFLMKTFRVAFARIHAEAKRRGIDLLLENHPQGLLADAQTIENFLSDEGYDSIPVAYDVANATAIGEDPLVGIETLYRRIGVVHFSDSPKGQWRHDPIGSGDIDFAAIIERLRQKGFDKTIILEILSEQPLQGLIDGAALLEKAGLRTQR